jgi:outer membrane protein
MKKILITSFYLLVTNLNAQDSLTFKQCLDIAFENNIGILRQKNQADIYKLNIKKAEDARLPTVSGYTNSNLSWGRGIDPYTNTYVNQQFNTYNGGLNLNLNLFNGFYHINNIKLQKQDLETNKSQWQKLKNDLTIDIAVRYTNILYLQDMILNIRKLIKISQDNIDYTQKKIDAGVLAKREIYKAIAQKDNEELNLLNAENNLETNILELKQLMALDINKQFILKDIALKILPNPNKSEFINSAIERNPSLSLQKNNLEKSKLSIEIAKSGFYPTFSLGGQFGSTYSTNNKFFNLSQQLDNNLSYGFNINANIPIFNQFQTRNKLKEAKFNYQSATNQLEQEKQNVYKTLNKSYLDLTTSHKKFEVSTSSLLSNQINYDTEKLKYEAGRITLQDLNQTKSNLFNSISNNVKDKYEWIFNSLVYKIYEGNLTFE